jgi:hypothetical protein
MLFFKVFRPGKSSTFRTLVIRVALSPLLYLLSSRCAAIAGDCSQYRHLSQSEFSRLNTKILSSNTFRPEWQGSILHDPTAL